MNGKLFWFIMAVTSVVSIYMGATQGVPAPEDPYHFQLMAEADFHCERLELQITQCGYCSYMKGSDQERCNEMKMAFSKDYETYVRHDAIGVLQQEVNSYLASQKSASSKADSG